MTRYIILILLLVGQQLPAMDQAAQDAQRRAALLARKAETEKNLLKDKQRTDFMKAIVEQRPDDAKTILNGNPQIITETPTKGTDWVDLVLTNALSNASQSPTLAAQYDGLAIHIIEHMKTLSYIPDQSHLLMACQYKRIRVIQYLLNTMNYDITFKGTRGTQSTLEWAQSDSSLPYANLILARAQQLQQQQTYAYEHAQLQQQVAAQQASWNEQYGVSPQLKQQFDEQQRRWDQLQAQHQPQSAPHTPSRSQPILHPQLRTSPESSSRVQFWKKVVVVAIIICGCKKLWNWYFQKQQDQTENDEPEDEGYSNAPIQN